MALDANARMVNIKRSLDLYAKNNLSDTEKLDIDYEGVAFDNSGASIWVQPRILDISTDFYRSGSNTQYAEQTDLLYQITIFVGKSGVTTSDKHYMIRDAVLNYYKSGTSIGIRDCIDSGTTVDYLVVRDLVTDLPLPEEQTYRGYALAWNISQTRLVTKP